MSSSATKPMVWYGCVCGLMDSTHTCTMHTLAYCLQILFMQICSIQMHKRNVSALIRAHKQLQVHTRVCRQNRGTQTGKLENVHTGKPAHTHTHAHTKRHTYTHTHPHQSDPHNKAASCDSSLQMKHPIKIKQTQKYTHYYCCVCFVCTCECTMKH